MASEHSDDYVLSRDPMESRRLEEQHKLYVKSLGYLIHPAIALRLPQNPRIADIATGTAVVLRDLAAEFPAAQLEGFDISAKQFPENLPSSIALHIADCKQPYPAEFHGKFDLVFLRCLVTAMEPPHDWEIVTRNVLALLKPGGAVQWIESQFSQVLSVLRQGPSTTASGLERLFHASFDAVGGLKRMAWDLRGLKPVFEDQGMVGVEHEVVSSDRFPETRPLGTKIEIEVCYGILKTLQAADDEKLEKLLLDAKRDLESGAYTRWDIHCCIGFKSR